MKLIYKLLSGYLILVLLAFTTHLVSRRSYRNIAHTYNHVSEVAVPQMQALEKIRSATLRIVSSTSEYVLLVSERHASKNQLQNLQQESVESDESDESEHSEAIQMKAGTAALIEGLDQYESLLTLHADSREEAQIVQNIRFSCERLIQDSNRIIAIKEKGISGSAVMRAKHDLEASEQKTLDAIDLALKAEYAGLKNAEGRVHQVISNATNTTTLINVLGTFLAVIAGIVISRSVSNRIQKLQDATQRIRAGNLDEQISTEATDEIGNLVHSFNAMTSALKTSRQEVLAARNFTESIIESMCDLVVVVSSSGKIQRTNTAAARLLGFDKKKFIGKSFQKLCPAPDSFADSNLLSASNCLSAVTYETVWPTSDNRQIPVSVSVVPLRDETGNTHGMVYVGRDITQSKQAEEQIQASLIEKDTLLKEIHHRVKNNLQIISSLLNMQGKKITDPTSRAIFLDSQNRVKSMALIHESLYQSSSLSQIDFDEYLRKLASHILRTYNLDSDRIHLTFSSANLNMSVDTAVPCGLIINELVSNSLKYAFPDQRKGEIRISLQPTPAGYKLECADDGIGLPPDFDILQSNSLGLKIVRTLTDQINGTLHIHSNQGTTFEITFP